MGRTASAEAAAAAMERLRARGLRSFALPQWFERGDHAYFCGLIARQIRMRAHMRGQTDAARNEALAIADMIEAGDFDWLM